MKGFCSVVDRATAGHIQSLFFLSSCSLLLLRNHRGHGGSILKGVGFDNRKSSMHKSCHLGSVKGNCYYI